jgi:hypothetical protein
MNDFKMFEQLIHLDLGCVGRINKLLEGEQDRDLLDRELETLGIVEINNGKTRIKEEYRNVLETSVDSIFDNRK